MNPEQKHKFLTGLSKIARGLIGSGKATEQNVIEKLRELLNERAPYALQDFDRLRDELPRSIRPNTGKAMEQPHGDAFGVINALNKNDAVLYDAQEYVPDFVGMMLRGATDEEIDRALVMHWETTNDLHYDLNKHRTKVKSEHGAEKAKTLIEKIKPTMQKIMNLIFSSRIIDK